MLIRSMQNYNMPSNEELPSLTSTKVCTSFPPPPVDLLCFLMIWIMHSSSEASTHERNKSVMSFAPIWMALLSPKISARSLSKHELITQKVDSIPTPRNGGTNSTRTIPQISSKTASGFSKNFQFSLRSQSLKQGQLPFSKLVPAPEILPSLS